MRVYAWSGGHRSCRAASRAPAAPPNQTAATPAPPETKPTTTRVETNRANHGPLAHGQIMEGHDQAGGRRPYRGRASCLDRVGHEDPLGLPPGAKIPRAVNGHRGDQSSVQVPGT